MKLAAVLFVALCVSAATAIQLPAGYNNAQEIANVLANEPTSAKESRFAQTSSSSDTITFRDSGSSSTSAATTDDEEEGGAEFDPQIESVTAEIKKLKESIKETEECARRETEQKAQLRSLEEQKEHLEKEKEKRILQVKLEKQMKDLSEINRMSRSLRVKFSELKRTQKVIKAKMSGTRSSLNQLDNEDNVDEEDLAAAADHLGQEMKAMQTAQQKLLTHAHARNAKHVKSAIENANETHRKGVEDVDA